MPEGSVTMAIETDATTTLDRYEVVAGYRTHYVVAGDGPPILLVDSAGFGRDVAWSLRLLTLPLMGTFARSATLQQVRGALQRHVFDPATVTGELVEAQYGVWQRPGNRRAVLNALRSNISLF